MDGVFFFSSRRRHTRFKCDWSSDVCSSDLVRGPMMVKGDYSEATMKNEVWQKDMTIIGDFARALDCPTPLFAASAPIYNAAMAMGLGKQDTGAVCAVLEEMAGRPRPKKKRARR